MLNPLISEAFWTIVCFIAITLLTYAGNNFHKLEEGNWVERTIYTLLVKSDDN